MSEPLAGFTVSKGRQILANLDEAGTRPGQRAHIEDGARLYIAYTHSGAIPARSGTTVGSGVATLYYINDSDVLTAKTDSTGANIVVTVKNLSTSTVGASKYVQLKREYGSGRWLVDFEDC